MGRNVRNVQHVCWFYKTKAFFLLVIRCCKQCRRGVEDRKLLKFEWDITCLRGQGTGSNLGHPRDRPDYLHY